MPNLAQQQIKLMFMTWLAQIKCVSPFTIVLAKTTDAVVGVDFQNSLAGLERISVHVLGNTVKMFIMNYGNKLSFLIVFFFWWCCHRLSFVLACSFHLSPACPGYTIVDLIYLNFVWHFQIVLPFSYDFHPFQSFATRHDTQRLSW